MFKIVHGYVDIDIKVFFSSPQANITRNSERKLFIKTCKTNKHKFISP